MDDMPHAASEISSKKKWTTGRKIGCGCVLAALLALIIAIVLGVIAWQWAMAFPRAFQEQGYATVSGQKISVPHDATVSADTVYIGQHVQFNGVATGNLAFFCQVVEIKGTVEGDIDILGQVLKILPGGVVKGDIRCEGLQVLQNDGSIEGAVSGTVQMQLRGKLRE